ncbi:phage head morphogenesis protein [Mameliella alba]|uniref:phage head morphogenesis protein n=1 Tax=Mameliella alba TaxID=561184 RepID=UPI0013E46382|nr:phage minor head protein [Mameliella alba]BBU57396.1 phage head morphogenesis protein [Mameliella alba]
MADPDLRGTFRRPFTEQVAAWRLRLGNLVPTDRWDDIRKDQHNRSFMVSGAKKAALLEDFAGAIGKAIEQGTGLDAFAKDFRKIVSDHGWHGWTGEGTAKGEMWRIRTIYRTNMRTTYMAGRYAQLVEGGFKYWIYRHGGSVEPRLRHLGWDGLVLEADHPFWQTHFPPNGWGCSCRVFGSRTRAGARRKGGDPDKVLPDNWQDLDPRTGEQRGIGKGWGYAPGAGVVDTVRVGAEMLRKMHPRIGADYGQSLSGLVAEAWPLWLADVIAGAQKHPALLGAISPQLQQALAQRSIAPQSAEIMIGPNVIVGKKGLRHEVAGDALEEVDWMRLPQLIAAPDVVLLDERSGRVLFLQLDADRLPQLVVALDYVRKGEVFNLVRSAYRPRLSDIKARIKGGLLTVLQGEV